MNRQTVEQEEVRVGYLALTDCAPIIVAAALGFDRLYGIRMGTGWKSMGKVRTFAAVAQITGEGVAAKHAESA